MKRLLLAMAATLLFSLTAFSQSQMLTLDSAPFGIAAGSSQSSDSGIVPATARHHHRRHHHRHPRG